MKTKGLCGVDCTKCPAYIAYKTNDEQLRFQTAKEWSSKFQFECTPEMINCSGCTAKGPKVEYCENMCLVRKCASKKKIRCSDCSDSTNCSILGELKKNFEKED